MFLSIHLNLPIESANKNTQNSEMNSACFCLRFLSLKNSRKNGIINFRKNNLHGGLAMPYDKKTRDALQAYYEKHDFTGNIPVFDDQKYTPAQLRKLQRCLYSPETFYSPGAVFCLQSIRSVTAHKNGGIDIKVRSL